MRKLWLTGFVFLIPHSLTLIRLSSAIFLTLGHIILLQRTAPYAQQSTAFIAVGSGVTLLCTLLAALLLKVYDELPEAQVVGFFGMESAFPLAMAVLGFNFAVLAAVAAILFAEFASIRTLKCENGLPPTVELAHGKRHHLFLSHHWDNQDAVAAVKRQLELLLPEVKIFLDVDNLESIDKLEEYVQGSAAVLVFLGSPSYFASRNCLREVAAASDHKLPLVLLHESDSSKHTASLDELVIKCPSEHADFIFPQGEETPVVSWHRLREFQLVSLAQIAEQMLRASPAYDKNVELPLFVPHGLAWAQPAVDASGGLHMYVSQLNMDAAKEALQEGAREVQEVQEEMCALLGERLHDAHAPPAVGSSPTRWLLYLYPGCFEGEHGAKLAKEVEDALEGGVKPAELVMVYNPDFQSQADGGHGDKDPVTKQIIDRTPKSLRAKGLFNALLIEWRSGEHRRVSVRMVARALGARMTQTGSRRRWIR